MPKPARIEDVFVDLTMTIQQALFCVNSTGCGIALVVDGEHRLLHTLTDGDLRRAILQKMDLSMPIETLVQSKHLSLDSKPVTALISSSKRSLLETMNRYRIRHIPLLDEQGRVKDLALMEDLVEDLPISQAMVMAGGFGKRLQPLTHDIPKPLLPVGDRPLIQRVVEQLHAAGINNLNISTHFLGDQIKKHFGDGHQYGVHIDYVSEDRPLGTAGALGLIDCPKDPMLIMNGDILTQLDFRALKHFHNDNEAIMTVAVKQFAVQVPYGVVDVDGSRITRIREKPTDSFFVVAGIYYLNPEVWEYLSKGDYCDMPDLIIRLLRANRKVVSFPISEYWLDIGKMQDYKNAQADVAKGQF